MSMNKEEGFEGSLDQFLSSKHHDTVALIYEEGVVSNKTFDYTKKATKEVTLRILGHQKFEVIFPSKVESLNFEMWAENVESPVFPSVNFAIYNLKELTLSGVKMKVPLNLQLPECIKEITFLNTTNVTLAASSLCLDHVEISESHNCKITSENSLLTMDDISMKILSVQSVTIFDVTCKTFEFSTVFEVSISSSFFEQIIESSSFEKLSLSFLQPELSSEEREDIQNSKIHIDLSNHSVKALSLSNYSNLTLDLPNDMESLDVSYCSDLQLTSKAFDQQVEVETEGCEECYILDTLLPNNDSFSFNTIH
ncbi:hypothetical protein EIN_268050 [Entamoeba invadens IP1]|uniref:Uncharacterized protein n=1 Tax=Entamoeba invadens IP1 TaxID=370355 RepID=A0A0A1U813_ENTIV|nr:hypothetical protein EIN_268050 [Entamoeba invadens IP1]ELP91069.1 hypothetical protein EIN_268050 [Entamoeba invadens IP1]|eukprot:XP_004257840.1 hypothetical protein EIN_268050 [Entamoeba invadens IP1]